MKVKTQLLASIFAALTAIGAFIKIPLGEMSITLQVMFSLMAGLMLGEKWGAASQAIYVILGLIGVPIFTAGGGPQYVLQPSFGFIIGLIPMAYIAGRAVKGGLTVKKCFWGCAAGLTALYLIGLPYMYLILVFYLKKAVSISYVLTYGMLVYLPFDFIKIVIASLTAVKLNPIIMRQQT